MRLNSFIESSLDNRRSLIVERAGVVLNFSGCRVKHVSSENGFSTGDEVNAVSELEFEFLLAFVGIPADSVDTVV